MRRRTLLKAGAGALPMAAFASTTVSGDETSQESYEPLDSLELDEAAEVFVDGDAAYVSAGDGLTVVDISDPENLSVLAEQRGLEIGGQELTMALDLWAWEDRVALVGPIQPVGGGTGFVIFDVSDPAEPEIDTKFDTGYYTHNSAFADDMLYLTGSGLVRQERRLPLVIYDVSGDEPEEVNRWSPSDHDEVWSEVPIGQRVLHDVHVQDGIAYLSYWDSGVFVVDVSDPTSPEVLSRIGDYTPEELTDLTRQEASQEYLTPDGNAHVAMVNDDASVLAIGVEAWAGEFEGEMAGGPGAIDLYDISDKTDPQHLSTIEPPESFDQTTAGWYTTAHNPHFAGDRLYTSWYYGGVKVHDVSDPANPQELAWWRKPREANMWAAHAGQPGEFFVGTSWSQGSDNPALAQHAAGIYTFPDSEGEQADAPDLTSRPEDLLDSSSSEEDDTQENGGENDQENGGENDGEMEDGNGNGGEDDGDGETEDGDGNGNQDGEMENGDENGGESGDGMENGGEDDQSTPTEEDTDDGSGPGFGVGGAIAAIGGGSYMLARRAGLVDDEDE